MNETNCKMKCVQCAFWTCTFDNACINPCSPRFKREYVDPDEKACSEFEPEMP